MTRNTSEDKDRQYNDQKKKQTEMTKSEGQTIQ